MTREQEWLEALRVTREQEWLEAEELVARLACVLALLRDVDERVQEVVDTAYRGDV